MPRHFHALTTTATLSAVTAASLLAGGPAHAADTHEVKSGDTLWDISRHYGVPLQDIFASNGLGEGSIIYPGNKVVFGAEKTTPAAPKPAAAPAEEPVKEAEEAQPWFRISIRPSTPAAEPAPTQVPAPAAEPEAENTYTTKAGDTLWAIAAAHQITLDDLLSWNKIDPADLLMIGADLKVSAPAAQPVFIPTPHAEPHPKQAAEWAAPRTVAEVKATVDTTARTMGVDRALALAIAEQESGFRTVVTSSAGALGVMQVMPANETWAGELAGRSLDLRNPDDNIVAGVAILRHLVAIAPTLDIAIASYYQGYYGVTNNGMYEDTKAYVASVKQRMATYR